MLHKSFFFILLFFLPSLVSAQEYQVPPEILEKMSNAVLEYALNEWDYGTLKVEEIEATYAETEGMHRARANVKIRGRNPKRKGIPAAELERFVFYLEEYGSRWYAIRMYTVGMPQFEEVE